MVVVFRKFRRLRRKLGLRIPKENMSISGKLTQFLIAAPAAT